ncbi:MAG: hypothetical protein KIS87_13325 [Phycisphaeraceae bacterium]|nr:hypothetical protein [Phycisphaeraceae bacterium]
MKRALGVVAAAAVGAAAWAEDGLLVVAPRELAGALGEFVEFKRERLATTLVTLEDALAAGEGVDDAERLKRYLFGRWREGGVRYVLLVGDADVMPVRYMVLDRWTEPAFHYAFYPSDLYYADLAKRDGSFEDWNGRTDGFHAHYFGEVRGETNKDDPINFDGVDYRPEVGLGRWPVSTPEEARLVAAKTMRHERAVERGEGEWLGRAGLVMVGGWVDARPRFEAVRARLEPVWHMERMYYEGGAYGVAEPTEPGVVDLINSGVRLVLHAGHGNDDLWEHCLSVGSLERLRNSETLPVMMSAGCSTARFATLPPYEAYEDAQGVRHAGTNNGQVFTGPPPAPACYARGEFNMTGLGERFVRADEGGAVAYIGCNTGSQPCGLTLIDGFVDGLMTVKGARLGDCWAHAVAFYYEREGLATIVPTESWYPASVFFQGMKFMLFGDPSLPMRGK